MIKNYKIRNLFFLAILSLLFACAVSPKFHTGDVDIHLTLQQAADNSQTLGKRVLWGGVIIDSKNLPDKSQLEILAYPLTSSQRPNLDKEPLGRFIASKEAYLETKDYAQGRLITILGTLERSITGQIGESEYIYPVVAVDESFIWKKSPSSDTQFHIGIGVLFHN